LDGFEVTRGWYWGIRMWHPKDVIIRNCKVYRNNQRYEVGGSQSASHGGIDVAGGERLTIEDCRIYDNGAGIVLNHFHSNGENTPTGCRECTVQRNFIYANVLTEQFNNAFGLATNFAVNSIIADNVLYDDPDGGTTSLGMINNKILRNINLHHWQKCWDGSEDCRSKGNNENYKLSVRGGGANFYAFNIGAYGNGRGFNAAWGIGDIFLNNTVYTNWDRGLYLSGRKTLLFNTIAFNNGLNPDFGSDEHVEIHVTTDTSLDDVPGHGSTEEQRSRGIHFNSDYNYVTPGAEPDLPMLERSEYSGHLEHNTLEGDPQFEGPDMVFDESDPQQVIHPEAIFIDEDGDGIVTIEEAQADIVSRFSLGEGSTAIDAAGSLETIARLIDDGLQDVIDETNDLAAYFAEFVDIHQRLEASYIWYQMIENLESPDRMGYGDLSGLTDLAGNPVPMNERLDMGAIQSSGQGGENQPPRAVIQANPTSGPAPLDVAFDGSDSSTITLSPL